MRHTTAEKLAIEVLLPEYLWIVAYHFADVETWDAFIERFNEVFPNYQDLNKLKLDPDVIELERKISCSTAALFAALWWMIQQEINGLPYREGPVFLVQKNRGKTSKKAHVILGLPRQGNATPSEIHEAYDSMRNGLEENEAVLFIHYLFEQRLKIGSREDFGGAPEIAQPYSSVVKYLVNRIKTFELRKDKKKELKGKSSSLS